MRFPNAEKYVAGFVREVSRGKKYRLTLQYKEGDKWVKKPSKTVECGKRQAEDMLREFQAEQEAIYAQAPSAPTSSTLTMETAITNYLDLQLNTYRKLEKSTYTMQMTNAKKHLFPNIGRIPVKEFSVKDIQDLWSTLSHEGLRQGTIHTILAIPKKTLEYYWKILDYIPANPFHKMMEYPSKSDKNVSHMDAAEIDRMLECMKDYAFGDKGVYIAIMLALYGGLRRGEICGLKWQDVDFSAGTLSVNNAIGVGSGGTYTKNPKNKSSRRRFPMLPQLVEALQVEYQAQSVKYNVQGVPGSYYVCGDRAEYMVPASLSRWSKEFFEANGIRTTAGKVVTLHALRHNFATLGVMSQVDIKSLQNMLGHASAGMTLDTYADADDTQARLGADRMGRFMELAANNSELLWPEESKRHLKEALRFANISDISVEQLIKAVELIRSGQIEL